MLPYILIFIGAVFATIIGAFWTLWVVHVCRSGASPIPRLPRILPIRRQPVVDEDDDNKPPASNGQRRTTVGP